jgi:hypothetical protein
MRVGRHSVGSTSRHWNGTATLRRGGDQGEPSLEAGVELAERGARRAVIDFLGRLHGFTQLGVPKRGFGAVGRYHPILRVTETGLRCAGPSFDGDRCSVLFWCGSLELLGWPWLAGALPLVCSADPLMGPL